MKMPPRCRGSLVPQSSCWAPLKNWSRHQSAGTGQQQEVKQFENRPLVLSRSGCRAEVSGMHKQCRLRRLTAACKDWRRCSAKAWPTVSRLSGGVGGHHKIQQKGGQ